MATTALPNRKDIPKEKTWDLEDIFSSDEQWEQEFNTIEQLIPQISDYQGKLGESAETLYKALQFEDEVSMKLGKLYVYARMRYDQDTTNSHYQGLHDRASQLVTKAGKAASFMTPELLSIPEDTLTEFLNEHEGLTLYRHAFERLNKKRPHVLSEKEEALLAQAGEVTSAASSTFSMLNNADMKFPTIKDEEGNDVEVSHGRFIHFLQSDDRRVREDAFKAMYATYTNFRNTFASTLSGNVKKIFFRRMSEIMNQQEPRH